ncbi:amidohydrolase [Acidocella sp.]|jgi:aminobenzoyl-glutamate utilization protein A|uniref:amidohydrolase n=1 Tax=Acidocella sp. TaxID=50710 RepID=UPI002F3E485C
MAPFDTSLVSPEIAARAVAIRRDLHRHPELGMTEFRTASVVAQRLTELGVEVKLGREVIDSASRFGLPSEAELDRAYQRAADAGAPAEFLPAFAGGHTAVVGVLRGALPGPVVALRVDMDALPILEDDTQAHLPSREKFASVNPGVMHACGHDGHTAIGLAVAEVLSGMKENLRGTVKLIFQPGEEGGRGALPMVKAGVVDDVDAFIAVHLGTGVPSGVFRPAAWGHLASAKLDVTFRGQSSHAGSHPDEGRNALLAAANAVTALYGISRHGAGRSRVNVGTLRGGAGRNVIADEAFLQMEVRGETEVITDYMLRRAQAVLRGCAAAQEVEVEIRTVGRTTTAASDAALAEKVAAAAKTVPGLDVDSAPHLTGGSEDATFFMRRVQELGGQAVYAVLGSDIPSGHHTPNFDINEADLPWAIETLSRTLLKLGAEVPAKA